MTAVTMPLKELAEWSRGEAELMAAREQWARTVCALSAFPGSLLDEWKPLTDVRGGLFRHSDLVKGVWESRFEFDNAARGVTLPTLGTGSDAYGDVVVMMPHPSLLMVCRAEKGEYSDEDWDAWRALDVAWSCDRDAMRNFAQARLRAFGFSRTALADITGQIDVIVGRDDGGRALNSGPARMGTP